MGGARSRERPFHATSSVLTAHLTGTPSFFLCTSLDGRPKLCLRRDRSPLHTTNPTSKTAATGSSRSGEASANTDHRISSVKLRVIALFCVQVCGRLLPRRTASKFSPPLPLVSPPPPLQLSLATLLRSSPVLPPPPLASLPLSKLLLAPPALLPPSLALPVPVPVPVPAGAAPLAGVGAGKPTAPPLYTHMDQSIGSAGGHSGTRCTRCHGADGYTVGGHFFGGHSLSPPPVLLAYWEKRERGLCSSRGP